MPIPRPWEILAGVVAPDTRAALIAETDRLIAAGAGEATAAGEWRLFNPDPAAALLAQLRPAMEATALTPLTLTESWIHVYGPGAVLPLHCDAESCNVTLSATLDYVADRLWPLVLVDRTTVHEVTLGRGEGVLFDAARLMHSRRRFEGQRWVQLTLHYARAADPVFS